jgi:predicted transcriptional regulator
MNDTAPRLGPLEARIMQVLWSCDPGEYAPIREVLRRLDDDLAYTTVMTVLSRLHDKGLVRRAGGQRRGPRRRVDAPGAARCGPHRGAAALRRRPRRR